MKYISNEVINKLIRKLKRLLDKKINMLSNWGIRSTEIKIKDIPYIR